MNRLRASKHQVGYYLKLHKGLINPIKKCVIKKAKKCSNTTNLNELQLEIESLNYLILKKLISSTSRSPFVKESFELSKELRTLLIKKYSISNKWMDGQQILNDFSFIINRYFNEYDFCCVAENTFKIKLSRPRKLFYLNEK